MNAYADTGDQLVQQPAIDGAVLESRGWVSFAMPSTTESDLREQLLALAISLGTPAATRSGGSLCDTLSPTEAAEAKPRSLSKVHAVGEFPLHIDTAHWLTPCRYVMLACVSPGSGCRSTLLMDTRRLPLNEHKSSLLHSTPLRVTNGRNSFFSTILSKARPFVRFDLGCMTATTTDGVKALAFLAKENWPDHIETVRWEAGTVVVIDNWRMLHGRGHADCPDADRKLLRISIR
jgi:alpha-ketoglutarate-dependent taurine dioxygenase